VLQEKPTYQELENRVKDLEDDLKREMAIGELLYRVMDTSNTTVWYWNIKTDEVTNDPRFFDILGYGPEPLKETLTGLKRAHAPEEWDEIMRLLNAHLRGESPVYIHENRVMSKKGEWKWALTRGKVVSWDDQGNPVLFIGTVIDITERKQKEEELIRHRNHLEELVRERTAKLVMVNEQLEALFNATSDGVVLQDTEGRLIMLNQVAASRVGLDVEKGIGLNVHEIFSPDFVANRRQRESQVISSGQACRFQERHDDYVLDICIYPIKDHLGKVAQLAVYVKDISQEVKALDDLKKREEELEVKTHDLEMTNAALTVLLKKREEDKTELEEKVLANMKQLVEPYLEELKRTGPNKVQQTCLSILTQNLKEIIAPFSLNLSSKYLNFSPTEIRIANLLKQGRTTKEMADLMNVSSRTIAFHRENIRKKLGISKNKSNLRSHILTRL
jgi:PAS domain S-box-containing protein